MAGSGWLRLTWAMSSVGSLSRMAWKVGGADPKAPCARMRAGLFLEAAGSHGRRRSGGVTCRGHVGGVPGARGAGLFPSVQSGLRGDLARDQGAQSRSRKSSWERVSLWPGTPGIVRVSAASLGTGRRSPEPWPAPLWLPTCPRTHCLTSLCFRFFVSKTGSSPWFCPEDELSC